MGAAGIEHDPAEATDLPTEPERFDTLTDDEDFGNSTREGLLPLAQSLRQGGGDPPPLKWSALRYGFRAPEDGRYGEAA